jgi:hypothetical protein
MPNEPKPHDVPLHEETDSLTYADDHNFYKVEKWSKHRRGCSKAHTHRGACAEECALEDEG